MLWGGAARARGGGEEGERRAAAGKRGVRRWLYIVERAAGWGQGEEGGVGKGVVDDCLRRGQEPDRLQAAW